MKKFIITLIVLGVVAGSVGAYYKYRNPGEEVKISKLAVARGTSSSRSAPPAPCRR